MLLKIRNHGFNYAYSMFIFSRNNMCTNLRNSLKCISSVFCCKRGQGVNNWKKNFSGIVLIFFNQKIIKIEVSFSSIFLCTFLDIAREGQGNLSINSLKRESNHWLKGKHLKRKAAFASYRMFIRISVSYLG